MISYANDVAPRNFWTFLQQGSFCYMVYLFDSFANGFYKHAICGKFLHSGGGQIIILSRVHVCIPLLKLTDSSLYLLKSVLNSISLIE